MKNQDNKTVLIALDYDSTSKFVSESGYLLGKGMGADIILLHVISEPIVYSTAYLTYMNMGPLPLNNHDGPQKVAQKFLDKSKDHLGDINVRTIIEKGDFAETILRTAASNHASVIVMGSHNHRWIENLLVGTVTQNVLKNSKIPVFIVPTKKHEQEP
jgi:nucleotide-binding universal stress UspA family protein